MPIWIYPNLNDTLPAAPDGYRNTKWQHGDPYTDSHGRRVRDVSCYEPDCMAIYAQTPAFALSQPDGSHLAMVQVSEQFPGPLVNYNARPSIPIPGGAFGSPADDAWLYVTITDPTGEGDTGSLTNLTVNVETTTAKVGVRGYTYIGAIKALPAGGGDQVSGGGNPPAPTFQVIS